MIIGKNHDCVGGELPVPWSEVFDTATIPYVQSQEGKVPRCSFRIQTSLVVPRSGRSAGNEYGGK
jgi:hypothetical protein